MAAGWVEGLELLNKKETPDSLMFLFLAFNILIAQVLRVAILRANICT